MEVLAAIENSKEFLTTEPYFFMALIFILLFIFAMILLCRRIRMCVRRDKEIRRLKKKVNKLIVRVKSNGLT